MQVNQLILQFYCLLSLDQYIAYNQTSIQYDMQSIQKNINRISNIKQNIYEKEKEKIYSIVSFFHFSITLKSGAIK